MEEQGALMGRGAIAVGSDHGGYPLKEALRAYLTQLGHEVIDCGTHSTDSVDYPVFAKAVADAVSGGRAWRGIIVDGAGIGSCMTANKVTGVRAAMAFDVRTATNAREHNDANVLTLGAGYLSESDAKAIVETFLALECTVDRHKRRVAMIDALDTSRPSGGAASASTAVAMKASAPSTSGAPSVSSDYNQLVDKITRVLTARPSSRSR